MTTLRNIQAEQSHDAAARALEMVLSELSSGNLTSNIVTIEDVEGAVEHLRQGGGPDTVAVTLQVINAFDVPSFRYLVDTKVFAP